MYLFHGMQTSDGVLRSRIYYTVSGFRRVLFFSYAAGTSASAEASVAYAASGDLAGEIDRIKCLYNIMFCFSQINGACGDGERV